MFGFRNRMFDWLSPDNGPSRADYREDEGTDSFQIGSIILFDGFDELSSSISRIRLIPYSYRALLCALFFLLKRKKRKNSTLAPSLKRQSFRLLSLHFSLMLRRRSCGKT